MPSGGLVSRHCLRLSGYEQKGTIKSYNQKGMNCGLRSGAYKSGGCDQKAKNRRLQTEGYDWKAKNRRLFV